MVQNGDSARLQADKQLLTKAQAKGGLANLSAYMKLSGPGWLQSAITLGGGSLASSLYLGVLAGFSLLWLQPLAMLLGIVMLSAIGYVAMSTGERPFQAVNRHVNPVLGWGWALASLAANMVWVLPQYSLATGVLQQNLLPGLVGTEGALGDFGGKLAIVVTIFVISTTITWSYDRGGLGVKLYEGMLKILVALIVLCFGGVVVKLALSESGLDWGSIFGGFVPSVSALYTPAPKFEALLAATGEHREFWSNVIVEEQRDVLISAVATAVGINMTFLFPYSILKRGWGKEFRGLAIFDLCTGMLIPFVLATTCVVVAATSQFHTQPHPGVSVENVASGGSPQQKRFSGLLKSRLEQELGADTTQELTNDSTAYTARVAALPEGDRVLAATLVRRNPFDLARSLEPFLGSFFSNIVFGFGVLAMALSTITLLMLISGLIVCEFFGQPPKGRLFRVGCLAAATGVLGPFFWSKAAFWLAIPTSVFGITLLPIAYVTFFFLMNQKSLLGEDRPSGGRRLCWNTLMGISATAATGCSVYMIWKKAGQVGIGALAMFTILVLVVHFARKAK